MCPTWCLSCEEALNRVTIPQWAQQHIIQRHYPQFNYQQLNAGRWMFYQNALPVPKLFSTTIQKLCSPLPVVQTEEIYRKGRPNITRHVYFHRFDFIVGFYHNRLVGYCETSTIKIVCNTSKCHECHRTRPTEVITVFPCADNWFEWEYQTNNREHLKALKMKAN